MKKKKVSAVIACYRDAQAIPVMYQRLTQMFKRLAIDYEIIFVNDGSPDDTETVLRNLVKKDGHVIGINHSRNFSSQMAFTSGMNIATGDALVFMDGDLQDPPELIPDFYKKYQEGYDVVYGIRVKRDEVWYMQLLYKLFYRFFSKLSYLHMPVDAGDFSLIDRTVIDALKQFPERDRFIRGLRAWVGFKQIGVPYIRPKRMFGVSTNNFFKNFRWAIKGIFSFSYVPLEMITNLSLIVCIAAFLGIIWQIIDRIIDPGTPRGITTILVVVLFIGAIQLLALSILGEYLMKIFEEVKQRPPYIVKSIFKKI
jgi:dolichol-phosphate mannosyltransferase